jgi:putative ABC transport system substrate-binding protein
MKRLILGLAFALTFAVSPAPAATIAINQYVEHSSLDEAVRGFQDSLAASGLEVSYKHYNAQARVATVLQIVTRIQGERPDLVLAVATPSAQATAQRIKDIPVLFTAVTDPLSAGLVQSMDKPGGNVTGTTDMNPIDAQVALIREIHPSAKTLGVIYNAGEANSVVQVDILRASCVKYGFTLAEATTADTAGVTPAARSLVGKAEAIYLPTDNTVISSLDSILKVGMDNKIPVYPGEVDSVRKGGVASLSLSYYKLGWQTGEMALRILTGKASPADMPVETQADTTLVINMAAAERMGVTIPPAVLERGEKVTADPGAN